MNHKVSLDLQMLNGFPVFHFVSITHWIVYMWSKQDLPAVNRAWSSPTSPLMFSSNLFSETLPYSRPIDEVTLIPCNLHIFSGLSLSLNIDIMEVFVHSSSSPLIAYSNISCTYVRNNFSDLYLINSGGIPYLLG